MIKIGQFVQFFLDKMSKIFACLYAIVIANDLATSAYQKNLRIKGVIFYEQKK
jgi:hypothetical protein